MQKTRIGFYWQQNNTQVYVDKEAPIDQIEYPADFNMQHVTDEKLAVLDASKFNEQGYIILVSGGPALSVLGIDQVQTKYAYQKVKQEDGSYWIVITKQLESHADYGCWY